MVNVSRVFLLINMVLPGTIKASLFWQTSLRRASLCLYPTCAWRRIVWSHPSKDYQQTTVVGIVTTLMAYESI